MDKNYKRTLIENIKSENNEIGMHVDNNYGAVHLSGGEFRNGKVGIMLGGDPSKIIQPDNSGNNSTVNVFGSVNAPLNVSLGASSFVLNLTVGEIFSQIDKAATSSEEKESAKSKFLDFIRHPLVAAIVGGLAGGVSNIK